MLLGAASCVALKAGPRLGATARPTLRSASAPAFATPSPAAWALPLMLSQVPLPAMAADDGFSSASYYTTLALYVLAFPGIYSLVKRSTKSKVVQKTYEVAGPAAPAGRPTRELAGDILAFFQANNYKVKDRGDVIIFEGVQAPLAGRASFLTFCVFVAMVSLSLVLTILEQSVLGEGQGLGSIWYASALVSPVAGKYYLDNAERTEIVKVKLVTNDDESSTEVVVEGDDEEVERFQRTLDLNEKGMVRVKGLFENA